MEDFKLSPMLLILLFLGVFIGSLLDKVLEHYSNRFKRIYNWKKWKKNKVAYLQKEKDFNPIYVPRKITHKGYKPTSRRISVVMYIMLFVCCWVISWFFFKRVIKKIFMQ